MKFREFRETSNKPIEKFNYESMIEQAVEINRLLVSIKLEEKESNISDIDQKWIRENESKEFNINYTTQQREEYLNAVKKLALQKLKGDLLFEGQLGATIRRFSSLGLNVSRESILKDIQEEVNRQYTSFGISNDDALGSDTIQNGIEQLKSNLGNIFESTPIQEQRSANLSGTIPREPAISLENHGIPRNNLEQTNEQSIQSIINHTEQEKQEIREQLKREQQKLSETLEWAKNQPNEPTFTSTRSEDIKPSPEWTKDKGISGYNEPTIEQVKNGLEQVNKEQNFDDVYEFELQKLTELKKSNNPNYEIELNNAITKISSLTDRIPDIRAQLESDISYEMRNINKNQQQEVVSTPILDQAGNEKILQEQQAMKSKMIDKIMDGMNMAGEFSFGDISMDERMSIMQNVQNKLSTKSIDELQMLLSTYQEQNTQEETMSSGMHR